MSTLIVSIIALALAQLGVIAKLAHWAGQKDSEIGALRRELDEVKKRPTIVERASPTFDGETTFDRFRREMQENFDDRDRTSKFDQLRVEVTRKVSGWSRAIARLAWRVENLEAFNHQRFGSNPRLYAVRPEPQLLEGDDGDTPQDIPEPPATPPPPALPPGKPPRR